MTSLDSLDSHESGPGGVESNLARGGIELSTG